MPKAFNMDCEDSDAQEAVAYLMSVRQQAQNAPSYTESKDAINTKPVDAKYLKQPKLCGQITLDMTVWESEVINHFRSVRQNVQSAREWKKQVGLEAYHQSMLHLDKDMEVQLHKLCTHRDKFIKNVRKSDGNDCFFMLNIALLPTLEFMTNMDFLLAYSLLEWQVTDLQKQKEMTYAQAFWAYCLLSVLEPPVDADCMANINILLSKAVDNWKHQEELYLKLDDFSKTSIQATMGMLATLMAIIKFDFR